MTSVPPTQPPAAPKTDVSAILDLLATHGHMPCSQTTPTGSAWWAQCYGCDWKGPRRSHSSQRDADHREHVAEVIERIVAERVRVVEGERDAAEAKAEGRLFQLADQRARAESAEAAHAALVAEIRQRLDDMASSANESELRWRLGEWLTDLAHPAGGAR